MFFAMEWSWRSSSVSIILAFVSGVMGGTERRGGQNSARVCRYFARRILSSTSLALLIVLSRKSAVCAACRSRNT